tara:strand:- start:736 stop:912 length:177 start_codon:yes stop_codon:yes gene_type:complete
MSKNFSSMRDFMSPKEGATDTRADRRSNARKAYKLAKKMEKDLLRQAEQTKVDNQAQT